jgi:hypothetical protein
MKALQLTVLLAAACLWFATAASYAIGQERGPAEPKTSAVGKATFQPQCCVRFKNSTDQINIQMQCQIPAAGWQPFDVKVRLFIGLTPPGGSKPARNPSFASKSVADDPTVPDIAGLTYPEAKAALESAGLVLATVAPAPQGKVILLDPAAGSAVGVGALVTAIFAVEGERVVVPGVFGMAYPEARQVLFTVGLVLAADPNARAGNVVSQDPAAGTIVTKGSSVSVAFRALVSQRGQDRSGHVQARPRGGGAEHERRELGSGVGNEIDRR